jgi:hypothetical protein
VVEEVGYLKLVIREIVQAQLVEIRRFDDGPRGLGRGLALAEAGGDQGEQGAATEQAAEA